MDVSAVGTGSFANQVLSKAWEAQGQSLLKLLDVMHKSEHAFSAPLSGFVSASRVDVYA